MEGDYVTLLPYLIKGNVIQSRILLGELVVANDVHAKALTDINEDTANLACTDNSDGLAVEVESRKSAKREVVVPCSVVCLVNPSYTCKQ